MISSLIALAVETLIVGGIVYTVWRIVAVAIFGMPLIGYWIMCLAVFAIRLLVRFAK